MDSKVSVTTFVSYATEDKERFVKRFAEKLRANGVDVWFDEWEINPGDSPVRKIFGEGLPKCRVVILVMSGISVLKPWVRQELDAAFVRKIEGKAKLIPLRLDQCEMPECLRTLRWEAVENISDYDDVFRRVLQGIFDHYPKPPLGEPPAYATTPSLRIDGLNRIDSLLLEAGCRITIEQGLANVDDDIWLDRIKHLGLTEQQISESQKLLEEYGFIELIKSIGPIEIYPFWITTLGFHEFASKAIPDFDQTVSQVMAILARAEHLTGESIAHATDQPLRIVEHVLEVLHSKGLIRIRHQKGGPYITVSEVSARLRREVADVN